MYSPLTVSQQYFGNFTGVTIPTINPVLHQSGGLIANSTAVNTNATFNDCAPTIIPQESFIIKNQKLFVIQLK